MIRSSRATTAWVLMLSSCVLLIAGPRGSSAQSVQPESAPAVQDGTSAQDIALFVDYSEEIYANPVSLREMVRVLRTAIVHDLTAGGYRVGLLETAEEAPAHSLSLKVRLDDYRHNGPQKILFARYELGRNGAVLLKNKMKLSTIKGSGKLARVMGSQTAQAVLEHLHAETAREHGQHGPE